jgi:hypothetical protein
MDYLKLNSTKLILQMVASNNGAYTWYNIVKAIDQMNNVQQVPPTYEVLKELTRLAYLQIDPFEEGNFGKYWITEAGFALLNTGVYKVSKICGVSPRFSLYANIVHYLLQWNVRWSRYDFCPSSGVTIEI